MKIDQYEKEGRYRGIALRRAKQLCEIQQNWIYIENLGKYWYMRQHPTDCPESTSTFWLFGDDRKRPCGGFPIHPAQVKRIAGIYARDQLLCIELKEMEILERIVDVHTGEVVASPTRQHIEPFQRFEDASRVLGLYTCLDAPGGLDNAWRWKENIPETDTEPGTCVRCNTTSQVPRGEHPGSCPSCGYDGKGGYR